MNGGYIAHGRYHSSTFPNGFIYSSFTTCLSQINNNNNKFGYKLHHLPTRYNWQIQLKANANYGCSYQQYSNIQLP